LLDTIASFVTELVASRLSLFTPTGEAVLQPLPFLWLPSLLAILITILFGQLWRSRKVCRREEAEAASWFARESFAPFVDDKLDAGHWACVSLNSNTSPLLLEKVLFNVLLQIDISNLSWRVLFNQVRDTPKKLYDPLRFLCQMIAYDIFRIFLQVANVLDAEWPGSGSSLRRSGAQAPGALTIALGRLAPDQSAVTIAG